MLATALPAPSSDLLDDLEVQRLELLDLAEAVVETAGAGASPRLARDVRDLRASAARLFRREERALARAAAPSLVRHAHEHDRYLTDLDALAADVLRGVASEVLHLCESAWVVRWLAAHASRTDRELA